MQTDRDGFVRRFFSASRPAALQGRARQQLLDELNAIIDNDERFMDKTGYVMADDIEVTIMRKNSHR